MKLTLFSPDPSRGSPGLASPEHPVTLLSWSLQSGSWRPWWSSLSPAFCLLACQAPYLLRTGLPAGLSAHLTPAPHKALHVPQWCQCCGLVTSWAPNSSLSPVCHLDLCVHLEPSFLASKSASSLWSLIVISPSRVFVKDQVQCSA